MRWERDGFWLTDDGSAVDVQRVHSLLQSSYWAKGMPLPLLETAIAHSLCFSLFERQHEGQRQIGFARVITDRATFGYLSDVIVDPAYRGQGLCKWMMACVMAHPQLQGFRRWSLATRDAHGLYRQFGFTDQKHPDWFMEKHDPSVYERAKAELRGTGSTP